ncbi:MAG: sigma-54-dependent Fis family transcriptional regulator [Acidobacteria bacterium]|nr:sigma-54-dependent Fis family transcriptional regulator [Acidobacteriota bacterium]
MNSDGTSERGHVLVVDDDAEMAATLAEFLQGEGYVVWAAHSAAEALALQERDALLWIALVDLIMSPTDGLTLMEQMHRRNPDLAVVIMTGFGTIETAVEAVKRGAEDYLTKPFDREAVRKKVARLMENFALRARVARLEADLEQCTCFEKFVYASPAMRRVLERAQAAAATDAPVLIIGETGTGKEMLAHSIHLASARARRPFMPVNCGALPHELVESELFGYRRGAFTGAFQDSPGLFASASGGTVFLDEIGEMPKEAQVKLLRVLQEGELRRVGSPTPIQVDVRVVSASNRPIAALRSEFLREDFYFRIAAVVVEVPPLRSRPEDIVALAQHFAGKLSRRYGQALRIARSALDLLLDYPFPGNVRELENILAGAWALGLEDSGTITDRDLRSLLQGTTAPALAAPGEATLRLEQMERLAIQQALTLCQGNRSKAAALLGISRDTLYRKLRQAKNSS